MSLEITKRPILVDADGEFRWNSVANPVNYELQRKDLLFTSIIDDGSGFVQIAVTDTSEINVGDTVFFSEDGTVYADQLTTVLSFVASTSITLNIPFIAVSTTGFINLNETRTNYRVDVFFFNPDDDVKFFTEGTEYQPNENGFLRIDTAGLMRSFLEAEYVDNQNQENLSLLFYIQIIERFSGVTGTDFTDITNPVGIIIASKQFLDEFGSILKNFTPIVRQDAGGFIVDNEAGWLTRFAEPTMWIDWPNFLYFLANDNSLAASGFIGEEAKDINKAALTEVATAFAAVTNEINRVRLTDTRLASTEEFRTVFGGIGVSLKALIDFVNASGVPGLPVNTMREAGTVIETETSYVRVPAGTGPDSLLELASFLGEL